MVVVAPARFGQGGSIVLPQLENSGSSLLSKRFASFDGGLVTLDCINVQIKNLVEALLLTGYRAARESCAAWAMARSSDTYP